MQDIIYRVLGRLSLCFDMLRRLLGTRRKWTPGTANENELDQTGHVLNNPEPIPIGWDDPNVFFPLYPSLEFSLWRAQEHSLFRTYWNLLRSPILDFGCGDGAFASVFSTEIGYGVDIDEEALCSAEKRKVYKQTVKSEHSRIPLPDASIGSVFSDSVLEHATDLENVLCELYRILVPHGCLIFSVPVKQYERDLAYYYGKSVALRVNMECYHRNLYEPSSWEKLLTDTGFKIDQIIQFQPRRFTFWFYMCRLMGRRGLSMFIPNINQIIWKQYKSFWVDLVNDSIQNTHQGGNIFVIAQKK